MKNVSFFDDSKVEKAPNEIEVRFQKNSELFYERVIKSNLNEAFIYNDQSIALIDQLIKNKIKKGDYNTKLLYSLLIGSYIGQYVIFNLQGTWVIDQATDFKSVMDCFIRHPLKSDLYFMPFACSINRIYWGKNEPIMSEIEMIKESIINPSLKNDVL
jgi:hypothetical protein